MTGHASLAPEFTWRDESERAVLSLGKIALAHVEPIGNAWVVRTLMHQITPVEPPARISVPTKEDGRAWIMHWAECRRAQIVHAVAQSVTHSEASALLKAC